MNSKYIIISIITMTLATYLPRALPLALIKTKIKNTFFQSFLIYMPYGVLSAMIFPAILYSTSSIISALCGTIISLILSYKKKGLLTVAISAVLLVLVTEFLLYR